MPDRLHFDDVASRHGDALTMWFEDAVDAADAEAERAAKEADVAVVKVPGVPQSREQVRALPATRTGAQPQGTPA